MVAVKRREAGVIQKDSFEGRELGVAGKCKHDVGRDSYKGSFGS